MKSFVCLLLSLSLAHACTDAEVDLGGGVCAPKRNLGQPCPKGVKQCPAGAACSVICLCPSGFLANGPSQCTKCDRSTQLLVRGQCMNKATINAACTEQEQCAFPNGMCAGTTAKTCQCAPGTAWDASANACWRCAAGKVLVNAKCLDAVVFGAACQANEQCGYEGSVCSAGKCACVAGTAFNTKGCAPCRASEVLVANECLAKAPNGAVCQANEQCAYVGGACVKNVCACTGTLLFTGTQCSACDGVIQNNMCFPHAARGKICVTNAQCSSKTPGSQCIGFACDCPAGFVFSNNACVKK